MNTKIKNIALLIILSLSLFSNAQNDTKWRVSLGANAVDIRKPYTIGGMTEDYFKFSENDMNFYGEPLRLAVTRKLTESWSAQVSLSANIIKKGIDWEKGDALAKDQFYYIDAKALYDLNSLVGNTGKFDPYLGVGVGYSKTHLNDFKVNATWGFNVFITDQWGVNFESSYNHNFKETFKGGEYSGTGTDFFQHSLGLFLNFGVSKDSDGDGIVDKEDKCPEEFGVIAHQGCPEPKTPENTDTDGDGVMDAKDKCPKEVGTVANNGCPEKDTDGDGIKDHLDKCPNEKGTAAKNGCPEPVVVKEVVEEKPVDVELNLLKGELSQIIVYFDFDSDVIKKDQFNKLNRAAELMQSLSQFSIILEGHTDQVGEAKYNESLSSRRAKNVLEYLKQKGVDVSKLQTNAQGASQPVSKSPELNRRVEIKMK